MLRVACRLLGSFFLAVALLLFIWDLWRWWHSDSGVLSFQPLGQLWYSLDPGSLNLLQAVIERYVMVALWDPLLLTILTWGAAPCLAVVALLLLWLGARS